MTTWGTTRRQLAAAALLTATITGTTAALLGASGGFAFGAVVFVTLTVLALPFPVAIAGEVIAGSAVAGSLLLSGSAGPFVVLPLVAGVVATAELLALAARLDAPQRHFRAGDLSRLGLAIVIGGSAFAAVQMLGELPGPTGMLAVALASGACIALSLVLVGRRR